MYRQTVVLLLAGTLAALAAAGATYAVMARPLNQAHAQVIRLESQVAALQETTTSLESKVAQADERISRLAQRWIASGGGTNRKLMPDAAGRPAVELLEVFSFDRNHAYCRVDTNPEPFVMPTHSMGNVPIPAHGFFMSMTANSIDTFDAKQTPDGKAMVTLRGFLGCHTEVVTASVKLGSRIVAEPAAYEIVAVDGGVGGGKAGDSFAFTVFFDEKTAPVNYAVFGPTFTFTGEMVDGEITIQKLGQSAP